MAGILKRRTILLGAAALPAAPALAQPTWRPERAVAIVVGFAPGGGADTIARGFADWARGAHGVNAVVENRTGASGSIATERVARAAPDGHTVSVAVPSPIWVFPQLERAPYDPLRDLSYLAQVLTQPCPLYVRADSPIRDWDGFVAAARARPGALRWGTSASRGFAEILVSAAMRHLGLDTVSVPFRGGSEAIQALLGGHIEAVASSDFGPALGAGQVRLLVESGPLRIPGQEGVPTFRELGYPLSVSVFYGAVAPAGLPAPARAWWERAWLDYAASPAFRDLAGRMFGIVAPLDGAAFAAAVREGHAGFGRALAAMP
ncbi:MAG: tripartite tricarboxylate transporter substrate binding protein, partial [Acetobacteraceae bacterium]|nr:tripartite tricarboxylate transporter substrate binding protein [Acetobacteraceae bacterium]